MLRSRSRPVRPSNEFFSHKTKLKRLFPGSLDSIPSQVSDSSTSSGDEDSEDSASRPRRPSPGWLQRRHSASRCFLACFAALCLLAGLGTVLIFAHFGNASPLEAVLRRTTARTEHLGRLQAAGKPRRRPAYRVERRTLYVVDTRTAAARASSTTLAASAAHTPSPTSRAAAAPASPPPHRTRSEPKPLVRPPLVERSVLAKLEEMQARRCAEDDFDYECVREPRVYYRPDAVAIDPARSTRRPPLLTDLPESVRGKKRRGRGRRGANDLKERESGERVPCGRTDAEAGASLDSPERFLLPLSISGGTFDEVLDRVSWMAGLAERLNRTLVLPNIGSHRDAAEAGLRLSADACSKWKFRDFFDVHSLYPKSVELDDLCERLGAQNRLLNARFARLAYENTSGGLNDFSMSSTNAEQISNYARYLSCIKTKHSSLDLALLSPVTVRIADDDGSVSQQNVLEKVRGALTDQPPADTQQEQARNQHADLLIIDLDFPPATLPTTSPPLRLGFSHRLIRLADGILEQAPSLVVHWYAVKSNRGMAEDCVYALVDHIVNVHYDPSYQDIRTVLVFGEEDTVEEHPTSSLHSVINDSAMDHAAMRLLGFRVSDGSDGTRARSPPFSPHIALPMQIGMLHPIVQQQPANGTSADERISVEERRTDAAHMRMLRAFFAERRAREGKEGEAPRHGGARELAEWSLMTLGEALDRDGLRPGVHRSKDEDEGKEDAFLRDRAVRLALGELVGQRAPLLVVGVNKCGAGQNNPLTRKVVRSRRYDRFRQDGARAVRNVVDTFG